MKILICCVLALSYVMPAVAYDPGMALVKFVFGQGGGEKKADASEACQKTTATPPKPNNIIPKGTSRPPRPSPIAAPAKSTDTVKAVVETNKPEPLPKPDYLEKAEKAVKVKRSYKRDWLTLSANSMGAAGITYGARKSNWFIGSGGALVLLYSVISKRNTNSPLDQITSIGSGIGLGYLPKISSDKEDNKANNPVPTPLPPPPAP